MLRSGCVDWTPRLTDVEARTLQTVRFHLRLTQEQILSYYQGSARWVMVTATDGRRVRFPAESLRQFVTEDGVNGWFEMRLSETHKLLDLRRLKS